MERVEDLEGRLNREVTDLQETINELELDKKGLVRQLDDAAEKLEVAKKSSQSNDKNAVAQAAADTKLQISRIQQQFKEEKQTIEVNYKRMIINLESDANMKQGIFKDMTQQLQKVQEENTQLSSEIEIIRAKEQKVSAELAKKDADFGSMGASLAIQAQEKAMLKMEAGQLRGEL